MSDNKLADASLITHTRFMDHARASVALEVLRIYTSTNKPSKELEALMQCAAAVVAEELGVK